MTKFAYVLGVNSLGLKYAASDATTVAEALQQYAYQVKLLPSKLTEIHVALQNIATARSSDTVIFYFAGHGDVINNDLYLFLNDLHVNSNQHLPISFVTQLMRQSSAKDKLLILDCCRAGKAFEEFTINLSEPYLVLSASSMTEKSRELDSLGAGFFTYHLCDVLKNPNETLLNELGELSVNDLCYKHLKPIAKAHNRQYEKEQVPLPKLAANSDFPIITIPREKISGNEILFEKPVEPEILYLNKPITIERKRKQEKLGDVEIIANVAFNSDGNLMAFSEDNRLFLFPLTDRNNPFRQSVGIHKRGFLSELLSALKKEAHLVKITDVTFSPDGNLIASSDNDGHVNVWQLSSKKLIIQLSSHNDAVTSIAFSPKGDLFASASFDETVCVWKTEDFFIKNPEPFKTFEKKSQIQKRPIYPQDIEQIMSMAFSHNGACLATGDQKGLIVVREISTGQRYENRVHEDRISCLKFSPTFGGLLASASFDTRIRLTNFFTGEKPSTLGIGKDKHTDAVVSIAFSYKGDILISSSTDNTLKFWDIENKKLLYTKKTDDGSPIEKVAFYPNKYNFATDQYNSDISLWSISNTGDVTNTIIDFGSK
jgi:WD40 repeat protein